MQRNRRKHPLKCSGLLQFRGRKPGHLGLKLGKLGHHQFKEGPFIHAVQSASWLTAPLGQRNTVLHKQWIISAKQKSSPKLTCEQYSREMCVYCVYSNIQHILTFEVFIFLAKIQIYENEVVLRTKIIYVYPAIYICRARVITAISYTVFLDEYKRNHLWVCFMSSLLQKSQNTIYDLITAYNYTTWLVKASHIG